MPTYAWTRTRAQLRDMILRKLGVAEEGQTPTEADAQIVHEAIDARLKELHVLGVLWWQVADAQTSLTLTAGVSTVSLPSDFLFPVTLNLVVSAREQEIEIVDHITFNKIAEKSQRGEPAQALIGGGTVRLWPVPQTGYTAKLTYQAIAADSSVSEALDMPVAMLRAFSDLVAGDLIDDFSVQGERAARLERRQSQAMPTIRAINVQRVDNTRVTAEYF